MHLAEPGGYKAKPGPDPPYTVPIAVLVTIIYLL